jgi:hypothetical protein
MALVGGGLVVRMGSAAREPGARDDARCRLPERVGVGDSDANDESLRVFVFAGVRFPGRIGVKKKPSAPQLRLAYIHLRISFSGLSAVLVKRVTADARRVKKKTTARA